MSDLDPQITKIAQYVGLLSFGAWLGYMFYFGITFILYFYTILLMIFLFYCYALSREKGEKEKTFHIPIEKEDEENDTELPIIRY